MRRFLRMGACVATLCCGGGASAQTDPKPIDPGSWVTASDYPATALRNGEQGAVRFEVDVAPNGKPTACRIMDSSNSASLDAATCTIVVARATFQPAKDALGAAVAGRWPMRFTWNLPQPVMERVPIEALDKVALRSFAQIERFTMDAAGKISNCSSRKAGDLGVELQGCFKANGGYLVQELLGNRYRNGILIYFSRQ